MSFWQTVAINDVITGLLLFGGSGAEWAGPASSHGRLMIARQRSHVTFCHLKKNFKNSSASC